jgi:hypothetical protein
MRAVGLQATPHIHEGWPVPGSPLLGASSDAAACGTKTLYWGLIESASKLGRKRGKVTCFNK